MDQMRDNVWQRRGVSLIWDEDAFAAVAKAPEVWSVREFVRASPTWPESLPSNRGDTLVVAGLDACLDLMSPSDAEMWLGSHLKQTILAFQDEYESNGALIFWLPEGQTRLGTEIATDEVYWKCAPPQGEMRIDFGRVLWGETQEYPKQIVLNNRSGHIGLTHVRIT